MDELACAKTSLLRIDGDMSSLDSLDVLGGLPSKDALVKRYKGKKLSELRTPALVVDRARFAQNCARMHETAKDWDAGFRAHLKTHKTAEGTELQLISSAGKTHAVVVSTLMEAWQVVRSGLVSKGIIKDILYGLPVAPNKIGELSAIQDEIEIEGARIRILIDHPAQVEHLEAYKERATGEPRRWSVFVKIDCGEKRAGVVAGSSAFKSLVQKIIASPALSLYGFYCHGGSSYGSTSLDQAQSFLSRELDSANKAAGLALDIIRSSPDLGHQGSEFVLSIGSTPTAHAASTAARQMLKNILHGKVELHAGNYPMLDLQQLHTTLIEPERIAQRVLATVISYYSGRGVDGTDEALCDAGAIAMSKDAGPSGGFGGVVGKKWRLGRISQEHGVLVRSQNSLQVYSGGSTLDEELTIGEQIQIVGQHACLIAAAYPWYYVVDSRDVGGDDTVVDVWVPWKGW